MLTHAARAKGPGQGKSGERGARSPARGHVISVRQIGGWVRAGLWLWLSSGHLLLSGDGLGLL